jgi:hypothetical protein
VDEGALVLIACYPKSGGSWLAWQLIDILYQPDFYCDQVSKPILDKLIQKTERTIPNKPDVHMMRHPLDIACSAWNYMLLTKRAKQEEQRNFIDGFIKNKRFNKGGAGSENYDVFMNYASQAPIQLRYEDLLEHTELMLKSIVGDKPVQESITKYSVEACRNREHTKDIGRADDKKYSFFAKADKYYYKTIMNQDQISRGHKAFQKYIELYWPETI